MSRRFDYLADVETFVAVVDAGSMSSLLWLWGLRRRL